jgi:hypothetical protein
VSISGVSISAVSGSVVVLVLSVGSSSTVFSGPVGA